MCNTEPQDQDSGESEAPKKHKGFWFIILILLTCGVFSILVGPLSNSILRSQIDTLVQQQKLKGHYHLSGNLLSGFLLTNVSLRGGHTIQTLKLERLNLEYSPWSLLNKTVKTIEIENLTLHINTPSEQPHHKQTSQQSTFDNDQFKALEATIRPWVIHATLEVSEIAVEISKTDSLVATCQLKAFTKNAGEHTFILHSLRTAYKNKPITPPQDIVIKWTKHQLLTSRVHILPEITLTRGHLGWEDEVSASIELLVGTTPISAKLGKGLTLSLNTPSLSTDLLENSLGINIPFEGVIKSLNLDILNWRAPPQSWHTTLITHIDTASYQNNEIKNSELIFTQTNNSYNLTFSGDYRSTPLTLKATGHWTHPELNNWWTHTALDYTLQTTGITKQMVPRDDLLLTSDKGSITGKVVLDGGLTFFSTAGILRQVKFNEKPLSDLSLSSTFENGHASVNIQNLDRSKATIILSGNYNLTTKHYTGELELKGISEDLLNGLVTPLHPPFSLSSEVSLKWSGDGKIAKKWPNQSHNGTLKLGATDRSLSEKSLTKVSAEVDYAYPDSLTISSLNATFAEWSMEAQMSWNGDSVNIASCKLLHGKDETINLAGRVPLSAKDRTLEQYLKQDAPLDLTLTTHALDLQKIQDWTQITLPQKISGDVKGEATLYGTIKAPQLSIQSQIENLKGIKKLGSKPLTAELIIETKEELVDFSLSVIDDRTKLALVKAHTPFIPHHWLAQKEPLIETFQNAPLSGSVTISRFPTSGLSEYVPILNNVKGSVSAEGHFQGSLKSPEYNVSLFADIPLIELTSSEIGGIRALTLHSKISEKKLLTNELSAQINGGEFDIRGTVDLNNIKAPTFDLKLITDHALIYRDDFLSVRTSADLTLKGDISNASIQGELDLVESLFYKDIELIPVGVPSSRVAEVKLPQVSTRDSHTLPIPAPFSDWTLDVSVHTKDPILIRGNVAQGSITGQTSITGTLKEPKPSGSFTLKKLSADLPFSILDVKSGKISFTPEKGIMNPQLRIPGKSEIAGYKIDLLIYGDAQAPKTTLASSPPLPESELMTLLATGSTTGTLENKGALAAKAIKLFLLKIRQSNNLPADGKIIDTLLTASDELNLEVGKRDPFTGRTFTSARIEIPPFWAFITQIDERQNPRGLFAYLLRFK